MPATLVIVYDVTARKWFSAPPVWGYDMGYFLGSTFFMMGMGYTLKYGGHVSIDFLYLRFPERARYALKLVLYIFLVIPILFIFLKYGVDYAATSWAIGERVQETIWRPPLYPLKTVIPISYFLLLLQAFSETIKTFTRLWKGYVS